MANVEILRSEAEGGDAEAQYKFAMTLWTGDENHFPVEAREWFQRAADQGRAGALYELGRDVSGVKFREAKAMLVAAAEQGHAGACMELCNLETEYGSGEPEGIRWYRRAIELGHPHELAFLGILDRSKFVPPVSKVEKGARRGQSEHQYLLGCWYASIDPPFRQNMIRAYAWFAVAAQNTRRTEPYAKDWGSPMRAVRLLEKVLNDSELRRGRRLENYYAKRFDATKSKWRKIADLLRG